MPRVSKFGLSHHSTKGFRVSVGAYEKDGCTRPKVFWLGHDPSVAHYAAHQYRGAWQSIRLRGGNVWPPEEINSIRLDVEKFAKLIIAIYAKQRKQEEALAQERQRIEFFFGRREDTTEYANAKQSSSETAPATLYKAIDAFLESFGGKRNSARHKQRMDGVLRVNLKHVRQDVPLDQVDFLWLDKLCDHFKNRPPNQKDGKTPLSAASVKGILTYLRIFFTWIDDVGWGGWGMPRRGLKCFRVRASDLLTPKEVAAAITIKQFDVVTLTTLYCAASDRQRSIILCSLFTGATQHELSVMTKSEFDLEAGFLKHVRHKTKVLGHYWLPPELVTLLKTEFAARPQDELVWRTEDGCPLVTHGRGGQISDAVRQFWKDLRERTELPDALSFKYLRKFLADYCARHGGEEMGAVAMSHSRRTVLSQNYSSSRPFDRFHELQKQMHQELCAAGMFARRPHSLSQPAA